MSIPKAYFSSLFIAVVVLASTSEALAQKKPKPPADWQPPPVSDPYTMVLLPTLGGVSSGATSLNENGDVAGGAQTVTGEEHAAIWMGAASGAPVVNDLHDLAAGEGLLVGAAEGCTLWYATDINDLGQVVGILRKAEGTTELTQAFRYSPAVETGSGVIPATLDVLPFPLGAASSFSTVEAMNNLGECVGKSGSVPVVWWDGPDGVVATDLSGLVGGASYPMAINDAGQIAGHAHQAWRYTPSPTHFQEPLGGTVLSLGSFGGGKNDGSAAYGINNSGQVSGDSNSGRISGTDTRKSYRYTDGVGLQEVGNLGFDKNSGGQINDRGDVTGTGVTYTDVATGARSRHIFLYYSDRNLTTDVNNAIVNLDDVRALGFDDPQIINGTSLRVNSARQIIGTTGDNDAYPRTQGYMLVPTAQ